jgi:DNA-directed RNA polymerase specialized sigma24 family protein
MSNDGSVTHWINQMQLGDSVAVRQLWHRYFQRLVNLARKKLSDSPRGVADEEDVALSAFDSFCRRAEQGRFPDLSDRDGLWKLLVVITARKAGHLRRAETALKRGGQAAGAGEDGYGLLQEILSREPDPALAAAAAEEHRRLMDALEDDLLRKVAQYRMEGDSVEEIALRLGLAARSIKRKLQFIRGVWERELTPLNHPE